VVKSKTISKEISPDVQQQVEQGISVLRQGGLVAFPTDTVYGLGAQANLHQAVERVYRAKERPQNMALPLLLADLEQMEEVASYVPHIAWLLARSFLPGALTLVMHKSDVIPDVVTGGGGTVAVRIPAHPIPVALVRGLGVPIVGTSANQSGEPSALTASDVHLYFGDRIDLVIDCGKCPGGRESTVIDVTGEKPVILREGAISREDINKVCETG